MYTKQNIESALSFLDKELREHDEETAEFDLCSELTYELEHSDVYLVDDFDPSSGLEGTDLTDRLQELFEEFYSELDQRVHSRIKNKLKEEKLIE